MIPFKQKDWKEVRRKMNIDIFENNKACCRLVYDPITFETRPEYVDIGLAVIPKTQNNDYKTIPFAGHVMRVPLVDLKGKLLDEGMTVEEIESLATKTLGSSKSSDISEYKKYSKNVVGADWYDSIEVDVLHLEYKSIDYTYQTLIEDESGEKKFTKEKFGRLAKPYKDGRVRETHVDKQISLYESNWIIDTKIQYGFQRVENTITNGEGGVMTNYVFQYLEGKSRVQRCRPRLDSICLVSYKLQNAVARATGKGIAVDVTSLSELDLGSGKVKPLDVIKIKTQTGDFFYRHYMLHNKVASAARGAIQELNNGVGPFMDECERILQSSYLSIINEVGFSNEAAGTPDSDNPVANAKIAMAQTNNSLKPLYEAITTIKGNFAKLYSKKVIQVCKALPDAKEYYAGKIGDVSMAALCMPDSEDIDSLGIWLEPMPTSQEQERIMAAAEQAMQVGREGVPTLDWADYSMIRDMVSKGQMKQANMYMSYRMGKKAAENKKNRDEAVKLQGQVNADNEKAKVQGVMELEGFKAQKAIEIDNAKTMNAIKIEVAKGDIDKAKMMLESSLEAGDSDGIASGR